MPDGPDPFVKLFLRFGSAMVFLIIVLLSACSPASPGQVPTLTQTETTRELVLCNSEEDMPQAILDDFTAETGIKIRVEYIISMEAVAENIKTENTCDFANLDSRFILEFSEAGFLAKLNKENLPNIKNISANFRDLVFDPQNRYTVPYNWGTTGLLFRSDLVQATRWSDLWNPKIEGKIGLWRGQPRDAIALALKSLGFSANSEKAEEVNAAVDRLIELKSRIVLLDDFDQVFSAEYLKEGKVILAMGWAADAIEGRAADSSIRYILPAEGGMLWGQYFVIPAGKPSQDDSESFLNYILRPEVSAKITNLGSYATPNQAAQAYIKPELLNDPAIFPSNESIQMAEIELPLSSAGQELHDEAWERFLNAMDAR
jgi:spermidine/putrescine transport system substrate-binding protein